MKHQALKALLFVAQVAGVWLLIMFLAWLTPSFLEPTQRIKVNVEKDCACKDSEDD